MNGTRSAALAGLLALAFAGRQPIHAAAAPGDVNGDGRVDTADVLVVLQAAIGLRTLIPDQIVTADVAPRPGANGRLYGDGAVTVADATRLLQLAVGLLAPGDVYPLEPAGLFTLDAGHLCGGPASVSVVDLARLTSGAGDVVKLDAFPTGAVPSQMVVRGDTGYLLDSGANALQIVDLKTYHTAATIDLGANTNPVSIALLGDRAYVTLLVSGQVAVVDLVKNQVVKTIQAGSGPTGIVSAGGKLFVANSAFEGYDAAAMVSKFGQGTVSVIDPAMDAVVETLNVPTNPQYLAVDPWGRVHVVSTGDYASAAGVVTVLDPATDRAVGAVPIGGSPGQIAITFAGKAYLADSTSGLTTYDSKTLRILRGPGSAILAAPSPFDVAVDSRGRVYADLIETGRVVALDSFTDTMLANLAVGECPEALAVR